MKIPRLVCGRLAVQGSNQEVRTVGICCSGVHVQAVGFGAQRISGRHAAPEQNTLTTTRRTAPEKHGIQHSMFRYLSAINKQNERFLCLET